MAQLSQRLLPLAKMLHEQAEKTARWMDHATRWRQVNQEVLPMLAAEGWLLPPMVSANLPSHLQALFKSGGFAAVEKDLLEGLDDESCELMIESLDDRPAASRWRPTFGKALRAHSSGDYELAIPIWLVAIEGLWLAEVGVDGAFTKAQKQKERRRMQATLEPIEGHQDLIVQAILDVLTGMGRDTRKGPLPTVLNRNAVLHGKVPEIGARKDSVQCICALQVLNYAFGRRPQ
jgi:hypothetical protein